MRGRADFADALFMPVGIDLPALDPMTVRTMRMHHGPGCLGPHGTVPVDVGQPPQQSDTALAELPGTWGLTRDHEPIRRLTIRSAQATAIAIRFEACDVDGEVWVCAHAGETRAGPYTGRGPRGNGEFPVLLRAESCCNRNRLVSVCNFGRSASTAGQVVTVGASLATGSGTRNSD